MSSMSSNPLSVSVETPVLRSLKMLIKAGIMKCSEMYDFDGEEACSRLCVDVKSRSEIYKSELKPKSKRVIKKKIVLPFLGEYCSNFDNRCQGLSLNYGLYTQCPNSVPEMTLDTEYREPYCAQCGSNPKYGKMIDRMKSYVDGSEFKDPSGKTPKAYIQVMKKLNLTREEVEEEARKLKIVIDPVHFEEVVSKKRSGRPQKAEKAEKPDPKPKGRPKSSNTKALELNGEEEDIFAKLVSNANANDNDDNMSDLTVSVSDKTEVLPAKNSLTSVCKMAMNVVAVEESKVEVSNEAEEAKKASKKAASELEKAAKKEAAEAEKASKKAAAELEKAAKKEAAEAEKAAKKEAAELEKAAKKEAAEAEKAAKKAAAEIEKAEKAAKKPLELGLKTNETVEEEVVADKVTKLKIGNVLYYKSKNTGVIYDTEQEVVGMWNSSKNCIDFNKDNEIDEVDEEGYESENN